MKRLAELRADILRVSSRLMAFESATVLELLDCIEAAKVLRDEASRLRQHTRKVDGSGEATIITGDAIFKFDAALAKLEGTP